MTDRRSMQTNAARQSRAFQFVPGHVGGRVASAQPVRRRATVGVAAQPPPPGWAGVWWKTQTVEAGSSIWGVQRTVPILSSGATPGSSFLVMLNIWGGAVSATTGLTLVAEPSAATSAAWIFQGVVSGTDPTYTMSGPGQTWDSVGSIALVFEGLPDGAWGCDVLSSGNGGTTGITFSNTQPAAPLRFPVVIGWGNYTGWVQPGGPDYQEPVYLGGPPIMQDGQSDGWHTDPSPFTTRIPPEGTYLHTTIGAVGSDQTSVMLYRTSVL